MTTVRGMSPMNSVLAPFVVVASAWLLLDEQLCAAQIAGTLLVMAGTRREGVRRLGRAAVFTGMLSG